MNNSELAFALSPKLSWCPIRHCWSTDRLVTARTVKRRVNDDYGQEVPISFETTLPKITSSTRMSWGEEQAVKKEINDIALLLRKKKGGIDG